MPRTAIATYLGINWKTAGNCARAAHGGLEMNPAWLRLTKHVRHSGADALRKMYVMLTRGRYFVTNSMICWARRPFFDYWESKSPEIDVVSIWGEEAV